MTDQLATVTARAVSLATGQIEELAEAALDGAARNGEATLTVKIKLRKTSKALHLDCGATLKSGSTIKSAGDGAEIATGPQLPGMEG